MLHRPPILKWPDEPETRAEPESSDEPEPSDEPESCDWGRLFGTRASRRFVPSAENRSHMALLAEYNKPDPLTEEVVSFMQLDGTRRWNDAAAKIQGFCEGAKFVLDEAVPSEHVVGLFVNEVQETRAWVSDRNDCPQGSESSTTYKNVLSVAEFYEVLGRKVRNKASDDVSRMAFANLFGSASQTIRNIGT